MWLGHKLSQQGGLLWGERCGQGSRECTHNRMVLINLRIAPDANCLWLTYSEQGKQRISQASISTGILFVSLVQMYEEIIRGIYNVKQ
jgi:hypothetical protein